MSDMFRHESEDYCSYCGKIIPVQWQDRMRFYECNCEDAKKNREIDHQINELIRSKIKPSYKSVSIDKIVRNEE